jgi:pyruvate/2-oxoglutarate/acetoin dehydrogenase E1 component
MPELSYREAVRDALATAMREDDGVFIMGEDIAEMGGSMGVTHGMLEEFGAERVRNTPISEMALAGAAIGAAMQGMRPVAEIMYEDFMTLAAEQVVNQAAKLRYMSGGQLTVPVVFRTQGGAGWSPGAQHAQQLEAWFVHIPGSRSCSPRRPKMSVASCGRPSTTTTPSSSSSTARCTGSRATFPRRSSRSRSARRACTARART